MRYITHLSSLHHGDVYIPVTDGVVDITDEHMALFSDLVACGWLVPAPPVPVEPDPPPQAPESEATSATEETVTPEAEAPVTAPARKRKAKDGE